MQKCFDCNYEQSEVYCENCQNQFCLSCNFQKHLNFFNNYINKKSPKILKWHKFYQVCEECEKQKREQYCQDCEEYFCQECFKSIHKKGKRKKHIGIQLNEKENCKQISLQIVLIDDLENYQQKNFNNFLNKIWYKEKYLINHILLLCVDGQNNNNNLLQKFSYVQIQQKELKEKIKQLQEQYNVQIIYNFTKEQQITQNILIIDCYSINIQKTKTIHTKSKSQDPIKNIALNSNSSKSLQHSFIDYIKNKKSEQQIQKQIYKKHKKSSEYLIEENQKKVQVQTIQFKHPIDHFYQKIHLPDQNQYFCCLAIQQKLHQKALTGEISIHYENFFFQIINELNQSHYTLDQIFQYLFQNNILQKNIKQFSLSQQLTLISLRNSFLFAHENFLWIILSLKKDKISFSYQSILKRIESTFDIQMKQEDLFELFDDYIQLKDTISSVKIPKFQNLVIKKLENQYEILYFDQIIENGQCVQKQFTDFEDNKQYEEDDEILVSFFEWIQEVFQNNLMTLDIQSMVQNGPYNILSTQNSQLGKSQDVFSNSQKADLNCSFLKEDSDREKLQTNYFDLNQEKQNDLKICEVDNRKVFPGGIYGFALYTQYFSNLGKLISLVSNSLKYGALRHYKTFLLKNEDYFTNQSNSLQLQSINLLEEKSKFLQNFQYTLQIILQQKKNFINLAQLNKLIEENSSLNLQDISKYGFINKKQLIDLFQDQFSIIELSEGNFYIGLKQYKEKFLQEQKNIHKYKKKKKKLKKQNYSFKNSIKNLNQNPNNISTIQDYLGKIQSTIYQILLEYKQGIELIQLEKKTNKILKSEFDYITFGYDDFYQFLMTHMSQQIEVEVKQINPRERKFIVYLKSSKFGFKDGKEKNANYLKSFYTNDMSETNKVINKTIVNMLKQSSIGKNSKNLTKFSNFSINLNKLLDCKQISFALQNQNMSCQSKGDGGKLKRFK